MYVPLTGSFFFLVRMMLIRAKPLRGLYDLNKNHQQYAALDSWCTLKIYQRLISEMEMSGTSSQ